MSRPANKLPVFSSSGPDIGFELAEEELRELAGKLGVAEITPDARGDLLAICRTYLTFRVAEMGGAPQAEALDIWLGTPKPKGNRKSDGVRDTLLRMIALGEGAYPPGTDAGQFVEDALFEGLTQTGVIQLTKADIEPLSLDPLQSAGHQPVTGMHLKLSRDFMLRLAGLLRSAMDRADAEMNGMGQGFKLGGAFDDWCRRTRAWSKANGFPYGYNAHHEDGGASKFSEFLCALHSKLPVELRETGHETPQSMSAHLRRLGSTGGADTQHK